MAEVPPTRPRSDAQRSGCLTVIYVVLGLVAFLTLAFGVGTCMFMRSDTGQKVIQAAKDGFTLINEAANAPGASELREGGCEQAMVMPVDRMIELVGQVMPNASESIRRARLPGDGTVIVCQTRPDQNPMPSCTDIVRVYVEAVPDAPERFGVVVQDRGAREARCQGTYGRDGTFIEPFDSNDSNNPADPENQDWSTGEPAGTPAAEVGPEKEER